jgi:glycosyltransferase involved in cell wall biosynthesis
MSNPIISIITPSYNRADMIQKAIESVVNQDYPDFEHIIVDGGSADGTLELLRKYPGINVMSSPDLGMYDALNKGLLSTKGEIIGFLNTDDYYSSLVFSSIMKIFSQRNVDAVAGRAEFHHSADFKADRRVSLLLDDKNYWREITYGEPVFNAWFFKRSVFEKIGNFDASLKIAGDRDFLIRFALNSLSYASYDQVVYHYVAHQGSITMTNDLLKFSPTADENLNLVAKYIRIVPDEGREYLQKVWTRDTITAASRCLRGGDFSKSLYYVKKGWQFDSFWPIKFIQRIFVNIIAKFRQTH